METKICGKCKKEKSVSEFYKSKRDGYRSRCKDCHRDDCKEYERTTGYYTKYQKKPEVRARINRNRMLYTQRIDVRIKNMARWYTNHEIRAGRLNREPCAFCGREQAQAHHNDYLEPLIIVWLCDNCHRVLPSRRINELVLF